MNLETNPSARIPAATYRLQFNAGFTFDCARAIIGYLSELGISDLYASSYLQAKAGSLHGYDIVNQTALNREVGTEESFQGMVEELQRLGMGQILDFVPNHMCIESAENLWWMDVLENGPSSAYAHFFDIDWQPVKKELTGKVLLPFLGDQYGRVLEKGALRLAFREGCFSVDCSGVPIPLEPKSCLRILGHRPERLQELFPADAPPLLELLSIITSLEHLPGPGEQDPEKQGERQREKEIVKKRLSALCLESREIEGFLQENVAIFNGTAGDAHSFDLLDGLLQEQAYRLSYWRVATEEINYRRFFDINGLAAIRMEDPAVFEQTHSLLLRLIREKKVTGVRLDHVDGLYDPLSYLRQLQERCYQQLTSPSPIPTPALPLKGRESCAAPLTSSIPALTANTLTTPSGSKSRPSLAGTAVKLTAGWGGIRQCPPCETGGKAREARQGGPPPSGNTPLLHYVQLPPYLHRGDKTRSLQLSLMPVPPAGGGRGEVVAATLSEVGGFTLPTAPSGPGRGSLDLTKAPPPFASKEEQSRDALAESDAPGAREYVELLQQKPTYRPFYAVCEKILMKGEQIPPGWPVFGSTGYDFANQVNGVLVETENAKAFDRIYGRFVGSDTDFAELVYQKKKLVMQVSLSGEVNMLGHHLNSISEQDRLTRDFTLNSLTRAISEVIALFPVYRTYVDSASVREKDVQYIEATLAKAKRKNPALNATIFDFLRDVLLVRIPEQAGEHDRAAWLNFAMRFQQLTGPVMAKGLEDTTFYIYNRLVSLNDVGGTPGRFGTPLELFHGQNLERLRSFPHAMIATATHDSKRGEDLRARIDALSELPERWQKSILKWSRQNRKKGVLLDAVNVPGRNEEYLLYQTLLGAWPFGEMDTAAYEIFRSRIREYLTKAVREAKVNTSWNSPNAGYEASLSAFVDAILARGPGNAFLADFVSFQRLIAHFGIFNSLSQTLLKMVSPGVPDFYQGTELWDFSLVDPDNRGQVDYRVRSAALAGLKAREAEIGPEKLFGELLACREDGRIKLYLIYRVLNYRRANRDLFDHGEYLPLEAPGTRARNLCAFARRAGGRSVIAVAPRFPASLAPELNQAPRGERAWLDTSLKLPDGGAGSYRNVITGESLESVEQAGGPVLSLAHIFASAPVALLEKV
jgi:malto-oligosyltrehalose synthase